MRLGPCPSQRQLHSREGALTLGRHFPTQRHRDSPRFVWGFAVVRMNYISLGPSGPSFIGHPIRGTYNIGGFLMTCR